MYGIDFYDRFSTAGSGCSVFSPTIPALPAATFGGGSIAPVPLTISCPKLPTSAFIPRTPTACVSGKAEASVEGDNRVLGLMKLTAEPFPVVLTTARWGAGLGAPVKPGAGAAAEMPIALEEDGIGAASNGANVCKDDDESMPIDEDGTIPGMALPLEEPPADKGTPRFGPDTEREVPC